jgi:hypothetical protein
MTKADIMGYSLLAAYDLTMLIAGLRLWLRICR